MRMLVVVEIYQIYRIGLVWRVLVRRVCPPPPFGPGGRAHSLAAKGVGESQFQRGDIHCGALYI
jgi:hypothetical protein